LSALNGIEFPLIVAFSNAKEVNLKDAGDGEKREPKAERLVRT
jgi:hypothetical protein